jgi:peroxiredoxin
MSGTALGFLAAAILGAAAVPWYLAMRNVRVPRDATPYLAAGVAAVMLGAAAFVAGTSLWGGIAAGAANAAGAAFLALNSASGQARIEPAVRVGGPVLDFSATDDDGRPFSLASLRGRPVLLKFFRGHWCPYCVAELRRWEELRPELDARDVAIVTVCGDTAEKIRASRTKHGLRAVMIPDPDLAITDRYNLRNPKNFALKSGVIVPLPIPTTILVDAGGIVRWIDQSTDYMRRSAPERVLAAIRSLEGARAPVLDGIPSDAPAELLSSDRGDRNDDSAAAGAHDRPA